MRAKSKLLIVGAGPFGLAAAAMAGHRGLDHIVCGRPMEFWRNNMPGGMLLRSQCDWHLDPVNKHTIEAFLAARDLVPADVEPLTLDLYLEYAEWFRTAKKIEPIETFVDHLDRDGENGFVAGMSDGSTIAADNVFLAPGFAPFANVPTELAALLPEDAYSHTCDCIDLARFSGKRCLIIGGRQSAFEWAALLREEGAAAIHVAHRHETPQFVESDWSWVNGMLDRIAREPQFIHGMPDGEREELSARFWREGRLKLEPWLAPRLDHPTVELMPNCAMVSCGETAAGLEIGFDDGRQCTVDHVILATGYKPDMRRLRYLSDGIHEDLVLEEGCPLLDVGMQTSVPGLYVTSLPATRNFGLFFAFTSAVRASATIAISAIAEEK